MTTATTLLAAAKAPTHPALRWRPVFRDDAAAQHRRKDAQTTVCGLEGILTLAELTLDFCGACFPART